VACMDILPQPSEDDWLLVKAAAKRSGVTATYVRADITDEVGMVEAVKAISAQGMRQGAPLRGAIACAGIQQKVSILEYPVADFERIMRVNTVGTFITAKTVANDMIANGLTGSIVMIASMSGNIANRVYSIEWKPCKKWC
jgi:NAD(P)-dependent dehydrogenase (short-subunit alcohol dehydrogenase family)